MRLSEVVHKTPHSKPAAWMCRSASASLLALCTILPPPDFVYGTTWHNRCHSHPVTQRYHTPRKPETIRKKHVTFFFFFFSVSAMAGATDRPGPLPRQAASQGCQVAQSQPQTQRTIDREGETERDKDRERERGRRDLQAQDPLCFPHAPCEAACLKQNSRSCLQEGCVSQMLTPPRCLVARAGPSGVNSLTAGRQTSRALNQSLPPERALNQFSFSATFLFQTKFFKLVGVRIP